MFFALSVLAAEGCADLNHVTGATIDYKDNTAVVRCRATQETWHLVCKDNTWLGEVRNCTKTAGGASVNAEGETVEDMKYKLHYGEFPALVSEGRNTKI